jgi:hypothetical protein
MTVLPVNGLFIALPMDVSAAMPVYEHKIALEDGRTVVIFSWYAHHELGNCVKLFESDHRRSDYPRLTNHYGCKPNQ